MRKKFNIGDKVRRIEGEWCGMQPGHVGTIIGFGDDGEAMFLAEYSQAGRGGHSPKYFELVKDATPATGEADPSGLDPHAPGAKLDAGKVMAGQILAQFPRALEAIAKVGTFGARKYSLGGWLHVQDAAVRYSDAEVRHWLARHRGEELDKDSKMPHSWHRAWNVMAQLELELRDLEQQKAD
jgi:hypothetical protein